MGLGAARPGRLAPAGGLAVSADAGGGGGIDLTGVTAIIGAIDDAIDGWYEREAEKNSRLGADPCEAKIASRQILDLDIKPKIKRGRSAAGQVSDAGHRSVIRALQRWGRPDSRYVGVTPFALYLWETGAAPVPPAAAVLSALFGGPVGAAQAAAMWLPVLDQRLPASPSAMQGTKSGPNPGYQLSPGVYLYRPGAAAGAGGHLSGGILRGDRLIDAYQQWRTIVREDAAPAGFNQWRDRLIRLVGRARGDWRLWVAGDPVAEDSLVGQLIYIRADAEAYIAEATALCAEATAWDREHGGTDPSRGGVFVPPVDSSSSGTGAAVLGLLALAWLLRKKK